MLLGTALSSFPIPALQGRDSHSSAGASGAHLTMLKNPSASEMCIYVSLDTTQASRAAAGVSIRLPVQETR